MRWTFIIISVILAAILTAKADESTAQVSLDTKVTINLQNASLKTALKTLSEKARVDFAYNTQVIPVNEKVTVKAEDERLSDVLNRMISPLGLSYRVIGKNILIEKAPKKNEDSKAEILPPNSSSAQNSFYIDGWVTDSLKNPLVGATVANKTKNNSTITDEAGHFQILADNGDLLQVTFIGYKNYTFSGSENEKVVHLVLSPTAKGLSEVVVSTGYQKIPQERATGSFDFINNATINQQVGSNILDRINGVASGVLFVNHQPLQDGPSNGITIRGFSTINGLKDPLVVVDNFPYDGDITNINPNDIQDISILKDAAASSIWGVKAANGVIVITTKRGKVNKPLQINFNSDFIFTTKPDLMKLRTISSNDYINLEQYLFGQGYYDANLSSFPNSAISPVVDLLNQQRQGLITADQANAQINAYRSDDIRQQYEKYFYRQAQTQQYSLNLSGGSDQVTYYLSAGYDKNIDQLDANNNRLTLRADNGFKITKNFTVNTDIQYTRTNSQTGAPTFGTAFGQLIPYLQFADKNGNAIPVAYNTSLAYADTAGQGKLLDWKYYPLTDWKHSYNKGAREDILANVDLTYLVFKGLKASINYNYESQHSNFNNLSDESSYNARYTINNFSQIDGSTGNVTHIVPLGGILITTDDKLETNNLRGQLAYHSEFGKSSVDAIAGSEIRQTIDASVVNTLYGYDPGTLITTPVDVVNQYPTYFDGSTLNIPYIQNLQKQTNRYVSLYANASYTYDQKYILSASARRDASNLFGVSTNNKWNPLWSAGVGWLLSKEDFYSLDFLPYLKARATYGYSGNTNPALTAVLTLVNRAGISPTFLNTSQVKNFPNPDLRWEKDRTINLALDFGSKNNVLTGSIEIYRKDGIDLYGPSPIDPTDGLNGVTAITKNIANMRGKGIDVTLNLKLIDNAFKWTPKLLYSYNTSTATKYNLDTALKAPYFQSYGTTVNPVVGKPLYSIVAYKWAGLDNQGNPQGYLNGTVSEDYASILSNTKKEDLIFKPSLPSHFGSIINSFSYREFTLDVNIVYRFGYYFMKPTVNYNGLIGGGGAGPGSSDYTKRWQKPGDENVTNVPSFVYPDDPNRDTFYTESSANIDKADNIKLQYVNLGYDFSKLIRNHKVLKSAQVYINASNLGILWKANHDGIDPDFYSLAPTPGKTLAIGFRAGF